MKAKPAGIVELPDLVHRRELKRLKTQISRLKIQISQLRDQLEESRLAIQRVTQERDVLERRYDESQESFDLQLQAKLQTSFDQRTAIAEAQAEQALALSMRYRNLLLNRPRVAVAVALGEQYKREARARARQVKNETG